MEARLDMRASPRVLVTRLVVGLPDGDRYVRGNISSGGVGFEMDERVSVRAGDPIAIRLAIPETREPLALSAIVRHTQYREHDSVFYVGACFIDTDELVQNPLDRFVDESLLLEKSPSGAVILPGF